jgi:hypothetical protein
MSCVKNIKKNVSCKAFLVSNFIFFTTTQKISFIYHYLFKLHKYIVKILSCFYVLYMKLPKYVMILVNKLDFLATILCL